MTRIRAAVSRDLRALRVSYGTELPERLRALLEAARALDGEVPHQERVEALFHLTHRLTGSSAIYGFASVSRAAAALEVFVTRLLEGRGAVRLDRPTLESLLGRLQRAVEVRDQESAPKWGKG